MRDNDAQNEFLYLYCLTKAMPVVRRDGEGLAENVRVVHAHGIHAVVSNVSSREFSEERLRKNLSDMKWVESRVFRHQKVIEMIMGECAVAPCKFATIFKTEDNLKAMIAEHGAELRRSIEQLEGREEWGVKAYCAPELLRATLREDSGEIHKIEEEIRGASAGKTFFLQKRKDRLMEDMLNQTIHESCRESFETLRELSRDARINTPQPREATGRKADMILNAAFLVDKTDRGRFLSRVKLLKERYGRKGLEFDCTGPWPPYNFCSVQKETI